MNGEVRPGAGCGGGRRDWGHMSRHSNQAEIWRHKHVEAELGRRCAVWNIMNIMPLDACKPSLLLMFAAPEV